MECYICKSKKFVVNLTTETELSVVDEKPVIENCEPEIETVFCAQCRTLIYCKEAKDPWFIDNCSLKWDEEKKQLVEASNKIEPSNRIEKLIKSYPKEVLEALLAEIQQKKEEG